MKINYKNINRQLLTQLISEKHSLENNPAVPNEMEDGKFLQNLFFSRYAKLYRECIRINESNDVTVRDAMMNSSAIIPRVMKLEAQHKDKLEALAIEIVKKHFGLVDELEFTGELTSEFDMSAANSEPNTKIKLNLDSYEEVLKAKDEVHKRRLINALIQGGANSLNGLFHLYRDELNDIDHRLYTLYQILIPNAEIMYYFKTLDGAETAGGKCELEIPEDPNAAPKVNTSAMCFPILVQELAKGVLETISLNGLPENKEFAQYVLGRADYYKAENWDMLLGIPLWQNIMDLIGPDEQHLKHQVFFDLVKMEVDDFNDMLPEILSKSNKGQTLIDNMLTEIKHDMRMDSVADSLYRLDNDDLDYGDLTDLDLKF